MPEGLFIAERHPAAILSIMARKAADRTAIGAAFGCPVPEGPAWSAGRRWSMVAVAPGSWLAIGEIPGQGWYERLERELQGVASLSDQSGAYLLFRISGDRARDLLQRGVFIDLHPTRFGPGSAAVTMIGHVDIILWQSSEAPEFGLAVPRSVAASFRHWLEVTAEAL